MTTIQIDLPDDAASALRQRAALNGRPLEEYVRDELVTLAGESRDPLIGRLSEDAEILDRIVDEAMEARESRPWRGGDGDADAA